MLQDPAVKAKPTIKRPQYQTPDAMEQNAGH
jgi:hypothetical protein